jgi:hypothetical protein
MTSPARGSLQQHHGQRRQRDQDHADALEALHGLDHLRTPHQRLVAVGMLDGMTDFVGGHGNGRQRGAIVEVFRD